MLRFGSLDSNKNSLSIFDFLINQKAESYIAQHNKRRTKSIVLIKLSPLYRTDAKPRAEGACTLCRGAKEEDRRSKGVWGIGNTLLNTTKGGLNPPFVVLSCRDSNPERQNQNLLCYHYTTAQSVARKRWQR